MTDVSQRAVGANGEALRLADDIVRGTDAIALELFWPPIDEKEAEANRRKVYHLIDKHGLPAFKLGGICARRSTILRWIESQEQASK